MSSSMAAAPSSSAFASRSFQTAVSLAASNAAFASARACFASPWSPVRRAWPMRIVRSISSSEVASRAARSTSSFRSSSPESTRTRSRQSSRIGERCEIRSVRSAARCVSAWSSAR